MNKGEGILIGLITFFVVFLVSVNLPRVLNYSNEAAPGVGIITAISLIGSIIIGILINNRHIK